MTQQTTEQRCKEAVKKAFTVTREGLNEAGAAGNLASALTMTAFPEILKVLLTQDDTSSSRHPPTTTQQAPVTPVTPIASIPPSSSPSSVPLHVQIFEEFKKRLPAQLGNLLRVRDHTGIELIITKTEKLHESDFAAVCQAAEEMKGKWVSDGPNSAWHLPLIKPEQRK